MLHLPKIVKRVRPVALSALLAASLFGCRYEEHPHEHSDPPIGNPPKTDVALSTIDTGATLSAIEPGRGVGVFVEYETGGNWKITTACDTEISDLACEFDIIVGTEQSEDLLDFEADGLESGDYLDWEASNAVRMVNDNAFGLDGMRVHTAAGVTLRVDVYLDGRPEPRYIYWVGNGGLHRGAPTNPIDLSPSAP